MKSTTIRRIEAFEMWMYRRMLKISWTDHITNEEVLRRMNKERELLVTVKKRKACYLGHIFRSEKYNLLQLIVQGKVEGRRGIGRRRISWMKNLREWLNVNNTAELIRLAQDRNAYSEMAANLL